MFLYNISIYIAAFHLKLISLFNPKIKLGVLGRSQTFVTLSQQILKTDKTIWFHCASLGEYEQGFPVFKELRANYPSHKIILSFFSPSGYEIKKHTDVADIVVYLPLDTKANAKRFLDLVHPSYIVFVKYDIWPNLLLEVKKRHLKAILISAAFRKHQSYFKFYGGKMRKALFAFEHIFVQNEISKELLKTIQYYNTTVAGDTRFDRVSNQLQIDNSLSFIEAFKANEICIVIGSSWPEDDAILVKFIKEYSNKNLKYIIAPHNIKTNQIETLKTNIQLKTVLFSEKNSKNLSQYNVFIIDTIGLLSKIYAYADIAYVGGAMGSTGLHNILEPATFGVPIIIGKNYKKFPEANEMINEAGVLSIKNFSELNENLNELIINPLKRKELGELNRNFIEKNKGAVIQITDYIRI